MKCSVADCVTDVLARGYCSKHYAAWSRWGDPTKRGKSGPRNKSLAEKFWPRVSVGEGCWEWIGAKDEYGYGVIDVFLGHRQRRRFKAHRVSYELTVGPIPSGLHALHKCDNPGCVKPDHLFLGTQTDNMRDMWQKGRAFNQARRALAGQREVLPCR